MNYIKYIRIFLGVLIVVGIGLLVTQKIWMPKVVEIVLKNENKQQISTPINNKSFIGDTSVPYTNTIYGFELKYPNNFNLFEDRATVGGQNLWQALWALPKSYYQGSKISDVNFEVNITANSCDLNGNKITLNGVDFYVSNSHSGSSKDSTELKSKTYSTEKKSICYEISSYINYSDNNLLVYNPKTVSYEIADSDTVKKIEDQTVKDESKIAAIFNQFVSTFKFTK